jgi:hypothetical protein
LWASIYGTTQKDEEDTTAFHPLLMNEKPSPNLFRYFQDAGYVTAHVSDFCQNEVFYQSYERKFSTVFIEVLTKF